MYCYLFICSLCLLLLFFAFVVVLCLLLSLCLCTCVSSCFVVACWQAFPHSLCHCLCVLVLYYYYSLFYLFYFFILFVLFVCCCLYLCVYASLLACLCDVRCTSLSCSAQHSTIHLVDTFREGLFVNSLFTIFVRINRYHLFLLDEIVNRIVTVRLQIINSLFTFVVVILGKLLCE